MDWRADLWLSQLEFDDSASVVGGSVDFLTIRLGEELVANLLDALSGEAEYFAGLFDGKWLDDDVQGQFHAVPIDTALIVLDVFVAEPLRGHHLGPWMVADVVYRMLPSTSGIVLLSPDPATDDDDVTVTKLFALEETHQPLGPRRTRPHRNDARIPRPIDRLHGVARRTGNAGRGRGGNHRGGSRRTGNLHRPPAIRVKLYRTHSLVRAAIDDWDTDIGLRGVALHSWTATGGGGVNRQPWRRPVDRLLGQRLRPGTARLLAPESK